LAYRRFRESDFPGSTVLLRLKIQPRKLLKFTKVAENNFARWYYKSKKNYKLRI